MVELPKSVEAKIRRYSVITQVFDSSLLSTYESLASSSIRKIYGLEPQLLSDVLRSDTELLWRRHSSCFRR